MFEVTHKYALVSRAAAFKKGATPVVFSAVITSFPTL